MFFSATTHPYLMKVLAAGILLLLTTGPSFADSLILPGYDTYAVGKDQKEGTKEPATTFLPVEEMLAVGITGGVGNSPYKGYKTDWQLAPLVSYEGKYAYIRGMTAGLKVLNMPYVESSVFLGYDDTEFDPADADHKLSHRHSSLVTGLETRVYTPIGLFTANASGDISGHSNGITGSVSYTCSFELGDLEIDPSVGLIWSNSKYNDYYYGVRDVESERTGLDSYDAGAGVAPFLAVTAIYSLTDQWSVFLDGQYRLLEKSVKDSPMVNEKETHTVMTGIIYSFY